MNRMSRLQASMLEIYNEEYKDLLGKGPPAGKKHQVRFCIAPSTWGCKHLYVAGKFEHQHDTLRCVVAATVNRLQPRAVSDAAEHDAGFTR